MNMILTNQVKQANQHHLQLLKLKIPQKRLNQNPKKMNQAQRRLNQKNNKLFHFKKDNMAKTISKQEKTEKEKNKQSEAKKSRNRKIGIFSGLIAVVLILSMVLSLVR